LRINAWLLVDGYVEVDVLIESVKVLQALEIKSDSTFASDWTIGLLGQTHANKPVVGVAINAIKKLHRSV
jgi:hypothetical protein